MHHKTEAGDTLIFFLFFLKAPVLHSRAETSHILSQHEGQVQRCINASQTLQYSQISFFLFFYY